MSRHLGDAKEKSLQPPNSFLKKMLLYLAGSEITRYRAVTHDTFGIGPPCSFILIDKEPDTSST